MDAEKDHQLDDTEQQKKGKHHKFLNSYHLLIKGCGIYHH